MSGYEQIVSQLKPQKVQLLRHPIYRRLTKLEDLRLFMDHHVFAVWDFMCLLKALQRKLTCVDRYWRPASNASACRLINEIVLGEESDYDRLGKPSSHFELYRSSMRACGTSTLRIDRFLDSLNHGKSVEEALCEVNVPSSVSQFVLGTLNLIEHGELCEIAGVFALAREDLLPDLFSNIVDQLNRTSSGALDNFIYYLNRHIEVDGSEHGPMARKMVESICGDDSAKWILVENATRRALYARAQMWDGLLARMEGIETAPFAEKEFKPNSPNASSSTAAVQLTLENAHSLESVERTIN